MSACKVRSSVSGQPCLLEEGHEPDKWDRHHKYGPPMRPGLKICEQVCGGHADRAIFHINGANCPNARWEPV